MPQGGKKELVDLNPGSTEQVTLSFDEPKTGVTRGRQWIIYGVTHNGKDKSFFATPQGHEAIQEIGARKGDNIVIHVDNDGKWHVGFNMDDLENVPERVFEEKPLVAGGSPPRREVTFEEMERRYEVCLASGLELARRNLPDAVTNEDVRSIATSLYIQAERAGVEFPKTNDGEG